MVWLVLVVHFFLEVATFAAYLLERALWNLLIGCWQSKLGKFLKNHSAEAVRDVRGASRDPFPTAVLRRLLHGNPLQAPAPRPTGFLWIVSLWGLPSCSARCLWGQGDIPLLNFVFLGFLKGIDPDSLAPEICYSRDLVDSFWMCYVTLTFFLAENYIYDSIPLQEVVQTIGPNFVQTWKEKQKKS